MLFLKVYFHFWGLQSRKLIKPTQAPKKEKKNKNPSNYIVRTLDSIDVDALIFCWSLCRFGKRSHKRKAQVVHFSLASKHSSTQNNFCSVFLMTRSTSKFCVSPGLQRTEVQNTGICSVV